MIPYQIKDVDGYPGYKVDTLGNVYGKKGKNYHHQQILMDIIWY